MQYGPKSSQEYLKASVMTASPEQLQLLLIDGAIRFTSRGREAIARGDREAAFNAIDRAQRIVAELADGLNREVNPELVDQMSALYTFIFRRLVQANTESDDTAAEEALRILRHHRETWDLLIRRLRQEAAATGPAPEPEPAASRFVHEPTIGTPAPATHSAFVAEA